MCKTLLLGGPPSRGGKSRRVEALSHAAAVADLIKISSAADWQGCDVRRFGWAAAAKLITLGSAEKYKNDADGEKARVDGIFTKYKAASTSSVPSPR